MGIPEYTATDRNDYVNIAPRLGRKREYRMEPSRAIHEAHGCVWGEIDVIRKLEQAHAAMLNDLR